LKEWPLDEVMEHLASVSCNPKKFEKINTNFSKQKKKKKNTFKLAVSSFTTSKMCFLVVIGTSLSLGQIFRSFCAKKKIKKITTITRNVTRNVTRNITRNVTRYVSRYVSRYRVSCKKDFLLTSWPPFEHF
jgi:hypothetical protein